METRIGGRSQIKGVEGIFVMIILIMHLMWGLVVLSRARH